MKGTASDYFGRLVAEYDSLIRRCVPRYAEMTERLLDYLPDDPRSILELGCGTGNLTLRLLERFPTARLTTIDGSSEMVALTTHRAGHDAQRLEAREGRFEEVDAAPGSFDLVTSCISLHHVQDKGSLYRRLFDVLAPGGHLVFADQLRGGDERVHARNWERWLEFCRSGEPCTEEEIESLLEHAEAHDHYTPLPEHFRLLEGAGFADLDCVWRNWIWGIVVARRPPRAP